MKLTAAAKKIIADTREAARTSKNGEAYILAKHVAVLVRCRLKHEYPGVKFSVRCDHNSIIVRWEDGPIEGEVYEMLDTYTFGGFDGMIDMAYPSNNWLLPDGTMTHAATRGTEGSRGTVPASATDQPTPGAVLVCGGFKYVSTHREMSDAHRDDLLAAAADKYGFTPDPNLKPWNQYHDGEMVATLMHRLECERAREAARAAG